MSEIDIKWFKDSPDAGPDCCCSLCAEPIVNDVPVRIFNEQNQEARFHHDCFSKLPFGAGDFA